MFFNWTKCPGLSGINILNLSSAAKTPEFKVTVNVVAVTADTYPYAALVKLVALVNFHTVIPTLSP